jgi:hypothetical protein
MEYTIEAKPTKYNGRLYRSRLEARWSAFFDLCKWRHEYEPFDLPGWSPDFLIKEGTQILVEVKPTLLHFDTPKYLRAIQESGRQYELLLLEDKPLANAYSSNFGEILALGHLMDYSENNGFAVLGEFKGDGSDGRIGFCHDSAGFEDRISGAYNEDGEVNFSQVDQKVLEYWIEAGNMVMFHKPI